MKKWQIEKDGQTNTVKGEADIWTDQGFTVTDLGVIEQPGGHTKPVVLSKTAFLDHCDNQLGADGDRTQEVLEACRDHAARPVRRAYVRYDAATVFNYDKSVAFFTALEAAPALVITEQERDNLINNWPVG